MRKLAHNERECDKSVHMCLLSRNADTVWNQGWVGLADAAEVTYCIVFL